MLQKIINWLKSFRTPRCPKCNSKEIKELKENFLYTTKYDNTNKYDAPSEKIIKEKYFSVEYEIYEIEYQCQKCQNIFSIRIKR